MTEGFSFGRALGGARRTFRTHWPAWLAATLVLAFGGDLALEPLFRLLPKDSRPWAILGDLGYFFVSNIYFVVVVALAVLPAGTSYGAILRRLPVMAAMVYLAELVIHLPGNLVDWFGPSRVNDAGLDFLAIALWAGGWVAGVVMHALLGMASPAVIAERLEPLAALRRGWQVARGHLWLLIALGVGAEIVQAVVDRLGWALLPDWGPWTGRLVGLAATAWYGLYYLLWGALFLELRRAKDPMPADATAEIFD